MTAPTGRPRGRPPGSKNKTMPLVKQLARKYTDQAMLELVRIAGFAERQETKGNELVWLDAEKTKPKMIPVPGSPSDTARIAAINILLERGWGKAAQPMVGEDENGEAGGPVQVTKVELEIVPVGTPLNDDVPEDEEEDEKAA